MQANMQQSLRTACTISQLRTCCYCDVKALHNVEHTLPIQPRTWQERQDI